MPPARSSSPQLTPGSARRVTTAAAAARRLSPGNELKGKGTHHDRGSPPHRLSQDPGWTSGSPSRTAGTPSPPTSSRFWSATLIAGILSVITLGILAGPLTAGLYNMVVGRIRDGRHAQIGDVFSCMNRFWGFLWAAIVLVVLIALASLTIVGGVLLATVWIYVFPFMVDRKMGLTAAMSASYHQVVDNGFWEHLALIVVFFAIGAVANGWVGILTTPFTIAVVTARRPRPQGLIEQPPAPRRPRAGGRPRWSRGRAVRPSRRRAERAGRGDAAARPPRPLRPEAERPTRPRRPMGPRLVGAPRSPCPGPSALVLARPPTPVARRRRVPAASGPCVHPDAVCPAPRQTGKTTSKRSHTTGMSGCGERPVPSNSRENAAQWASRQKASEPSPSPSVAANSSVTSSKATTSTRGRADDAARRAAPVGDHAEVADLRERLALGLVGPQGARGGALAPGEDQLRELVGVGLVVAEVPGRERVLRAHDVRPRRQERRPQLLRGGHRVYLLLQMSWPVRNGTMTASTRSSVRARSSIGCITSSNPTALSATSSPPGTSRGTTAS